METKERTPSKDPPPYDYYNPSTWIVESPESEEVVDKESAALTDDIFGKLLSQHAKVDEEDAKKQLDAQEEADDITREEDEDVNLQLVKKPISQQNSPAHSPMRMPYRKAQMKIFTDEESDDSDAEKAPEVIPMTEAEVREKARKDAARKALIKHRTQFRSLTEEDDDDGNEGGEGGKSAKPDVNLDDDDLFESLMNMGNVPTPDPPKQVFALGKDGCAAVWWHHVSRDQQDPAAWVTEWEIKRFRLDRDGEWRFKGATIINEPHLIDKNRCTVENLENDVQYSFSVTATNRRGRGFESPKSEAVMVEAVLPPGWFRFWHQQSSKFFYSNIKTRQTTWLRPETDPWYLDEGVILAFNKEERSHLQELYEEEMHHFKRVTVQGFRRIMMDAGESMGKNRIRDYFQAYMGKEQLNTWTDFMYIVGSIKRKKQQRDKGSNCGYAMNHTCFLPCYVWTECLSAKWTQCSLRYLLGNDAHHEKQKIGDWEVEWSALAERYCYTNTKTHEMIWNTPEEVRFYLPSKMKETLLAVFSEGDIADFKVRFSHLDLNNSGFIDEHEFKLLLESMHINVSDRNRSRLIKEIDINGNGTIEFHEFCFMMMKLQQKEKDAESGGKKKGGMSAIWDHIKVVSESEEMLQAITDDMVAADMWEEEHGEHDQANNPHFHVRQQRKSIIENLGGGDDGGGSRPGTVGEMEWPGSVPAGTRPGTSTVIMRPGSTRPGTHASSSSSSYGARATTPYNRSVATPGGAYGAPAEQAMVEREDGCVWDVDMSQQQGKKRGDNEGDDDEAASEEQSEAGTFEQKQWRHEGAAAHHAAKPMGLPLNIDQITATDVADFCLHCHEYTTKGFFMAVDQIDKALDTIACKDPPGPHGRHCMCGCRRVFPEDVLYPMWTSSKDEPLTWGYVCPCCCSNL
jgi:hypothetical protein